MYRCESGLANLKLQSLKIPRERREVSRIPAFRKTWTRKEEMWIIINPGKGRNLWVSTQVKVNSTWGVKHTLGLLFTDSDVARLIFFISFVHCSFSQWTIAPKGIRSLKKRFVFFKFLEKNRSFIKKQFVFSKVCRKSRSFCKKNIFFSNSFERF